jgi:hypothetical protein
VKRFSTIRCRKIPNRHPTQWRFLGLRLHWTARIVVGIRYFALLCIVAMSAACVRPEQRDSASQFVIATADDNVLGYVHGAARGLSHSGLVKLIKAGISKEYQLRCVSDEQGLPILYRVDWYVTDDGRKPISIISALMSKNGHETKTAFIKVPSANSASDSLFIYNIAILSQKVLPLGVSGRSGTSECSQT